MKGIVSLMFSLVYLSLVYRKVPDFCLLILYPVTLLKCRRFLVDFFFSGSFGLKPYYLQIKIL